MYDRTGRRVEFNQTSQNFGKVQISGCQVEAVFHDQVEEVLPIVEEEEEGEGGCHSATLPLGTTSTPLSQLATGTGGLPCPVSLIEIIKNPVVTGTVDPGEELGLSICTEAKEQLGLDHFHESEFSFQMDKLERDNLETDNLETDNLDNANSFEPED